MKGLPKVEDLVAILYWSIVGCDKIGDGENEEGASGSY